MKSGYKSKYNDLVKAFNDYSNDVNSMEKMEHFGKCFEDLKEERGLKGENNGVVVKILMAIDPVFAKKINPYFE